jgi:hypothetical protein
MRSRAAVADAKRSAGRTHTMPNLADKSAKYYAEARHRAQRRKSPWNLILLPLCGGSAIAIGYALFRVVWLFHVALYPNHQLREFWQEGISFRSFVQSFLMVFSLAPGSVAAGFMLGNLLAWLIPPARHVFDAEAHGFRGTSFRASMQGLFRMMVWTLSCGLAIALTAAYFLKALR